MKKTAHKETLEFEYDSLDEKEAHRIEMEKLGYTDLGKIKKKISEKVGEPKYVYCGAYFKKIKCK